MSVDQGNLMSVSYAPTNTAFNMSANTFTGLGTASQNLLDMYHLKPVIAPKPVVVSGGTQPIKTPVAPVERKPMARLIRYTVVDPEPVLADKVPEFSILLGGTVMLNGTDDKGFLMDLAPKVAERLPAHNAARERVEYEDSEGKPKKLKPIKLSNLDVVVEVLKSY